MVSQLPSDPENDSSTGILIAIEMCSVGETQHAILSFTVDSDDTACSSDHNSATNDVGRLLEAMLTSKGLVEMKSINTNSRL